MTKQHFAGIDVGTSYIKTVILDQEKNIVGFSIEKSSADQHLSIVTSYNTAMSAAKVSKDIITHCTATGFGRNNVVFADSYKTEISSHARGAYHYFPKKITIVDIGGQDTKVIKTDKQGRIQGFKMNRKCAAGTGSFLEEIAYKLDISLNELNTLAGRSLKEAALSSFCTVFASTEILSRIKDGEQIEDMVKSAFESVVRRVLEMDTLEGTIVMTGGVVAFNDMIVKILKNYVDDDIVIPPNPQICGAIGAALFAFEAKD